jgi:hypothetical protein
MSKTTENDSSMNRIVENRYQNDKIYKIVYNITKVIYYTSRGVLYAHFTLAQIFFHDRKLID